MNDEVIDILVKIRNQHGESVFDDAGELKSLLVDYAAGRYDDEIRVLLIAVDDGLLPKLRSNPGLSDTELKQHAAYFSQTHGFDEDAANFAVNAWAKVLCNRPISAPPQPNPTQNPSRSTVKVIGLVAAIFIGLAFLGWWSWNPDTVRHQESANTLVPAPEEPALKEPAPEVYIPRPPRPNSEIDERDMVFVEGGTFMMGCTPEQGEDCYDDEKPAHRVTVSDFYIGRYEVTREQWEAVMGKESPGYPVQADNPVDHVSWNDVQEFIRKLNVKTGKNYRLPTEAEWEYAARGGNKSKGYKYSGSHNAKDVAWYDGGWSASGEIVPSVGMKIPNELGLYDMGGGVWEYCGDWYDEYSVEAQSDPTGPSTGSYRVFRGGGWESSASRHVRVSFRGYDSSGVRDFSVGFRLTVNSSKTESGKPKSTSVPQKDEIVTAGDKDVDSNSLTQSEPTQERGDGSMESSEARPQLQSSLVSVPFVGCRACNFFFLDAPPNANRRQVSFPEEIATRLAYYKADQGLGVLAPRGWYCYSSGGTTGSKLVVSPSPVSCDMWMGGFSGQAVVVSGIEGGTSGRFIVAETILRVFPNYKKFAQNVVAEGLVSKWPKGPYPSDRLAYRNPRVVEYETPANTEGVGMIYSALRKNERPVKGVAILHAKDDWAVWHLAARLESVDDDLIPYIIQQVESDYDKVLKQ
jgi:formylglycine-generating enzyme required for sulfatase activity